ncbi:MAG: glycosyltransferase family 4 protein [Deltaproteobacteria bacterium]|nr:glycosyltransferase family 4 protein [Deltaproteobacteria bacterium]
MIGPRKIYPEPRAGLDFYVRSLSEYLSSQGFSVEVVCHPAWCPKIHHLDTFTYGLWASWKACFTKGIIHYHGGAALFAWIPRLFGKKVFVTLHSRESKAQHISHPLRLFYRLAEKMGIQSAHHISAVSQTLQKELMRDYKKEVTHIPMGIKPAFCDSAGELNRLGLEPKKYILFLGRLAPGKGIELLLKAKTSYPIVIAGAPLYDKNYLAALKQQAPKNVIFLGNVTGLLKRELLAHALIYIQASENEGASIALLEALSFGLPLLVSDIAQNRELVGNAGVFFRTRDASDFQKKLEALLDEPQTLKTLGEKARDHIAQNCAWDDKKLTAFFDR